MNDKRFGALENVVRRLIYAGFLQCYGKVRNAALHEQMAKLNG